MKELTHSNASEVILSFDWQLTASSIDLAYNLGCDGVAGGQL